MKWLRVVMGVAMAVAAAIVLGVLAFGRADNDHGDSATASGIGSNTTTSDSGSEKSGTVTNGKGSEVTKQPDGSAKNGLPGLSKSALTNNRSLVAKPLPKTASSRGKIVAGFPLKVVPLVSGSAVQTSGVSSTGSTLQVSVQAKNLRSPEKIFAFYRKALTAHGFTESAVPSAGGATGASFTHKDDNLVVTVTPRSKGVTYTVFGTLHAGKSR